MNIERLYAYYEIKGSFCHEMKGASQKPVISISSRFKEVIEKIGLFLNDYGFKYTIDKRNLFYTLKVQYKCNVLPFLRILYVGLKDTGRKEEMDRLFYICEGKN